MCARASVLSALRFVLFLVSTTAMQAQGFVSPLGPSFLNAKPAHLMFADLRRLTEVSGYPQN